MVTRIVKMTFKPDRVNDFLEIFNVSKELIRASQGCLYLELLNDKQSTNVFFTFSRWDGEEDLERYRNSELFKTTWAKTKVLFSEKTEAWTLESHGVTG